MSTKIVKMDQHHHHHREKLTVSDSVCEKEDRYTASIDFANACREFYINRVKATESFKEQMKLPENKPACHDKIKERKSRNSIDSAMDTLRKEMASLMDQDLSLMKQLLTLNETIEEIKFKRLHGNKSHLQVSSPDFDESGSDWSISDTDMYDREDMLEQLSKDAFNDTIECGHYLSNKYQTNIYGQQSKNTTELHIPHIQINGHEYDYSRRCSAPEVNLSGKSLRIVHGCQNSIDSGYDETDNYQTDIEVTL